jgi:hypothetical protein
VSGCGVCVWMLCNLNLLMLCGAVVNVVVMWCCCDHEPE